MRFDIQLQQENLELLSSLMSDMVQMLSDNGKRYTELLENQHALALESAREHLDILPELTTFKTFEGWIEWQSGRFKPVIDASYNRLEEQLEQVQTHHREMFEECCEFWATITQVGQKIASQSYAGNEQFDIRDVMSKLLPMSPVGVNMAQVEDKPKTTATSNRRSQKEPQKQADLAA